LLSKPIVGLPTQIANDKGRSHQQPALSLLTRMEFGDEQQIGAEVP
jgi:hypothetical protein